MQVIIAVVNGGHSRVPVPLLLLAGLVCRLLPPSPPPTLVACPPLLLSNCSSRLPPSSAHSHRMPLSSAPAHSCRFPCQSSSAVRCPKSWRFDVAVTGSSRCYRDAAGGPSPLQRCPNSRCMTCGSAPSPPSLGQVATHNCCCCRRHSRDQCQCQWHHQRLFARRCRCCCHCRRCPIDPPPVTPVKGANFPRRATIAPRGSLSLDRPSATRRSPRLAKC